MLDLDRHEGGCIADGAYTYEIAEALGVSKTLIFNIERRALRAIYLEASGQTTARRREYVGRKRMGAQANG